MNPRQLLQAMRPEGRFDDWSTEDVLAAIITEMRWYQAHPVNTESPHWRN